MTFEDLSPPEQALVQVVTVGKGLRVEREADVCYFLRLGTEPSLVGEPEPVICRIERDGDEESSKEDVLYHADRYDWEVVARTEAVRAYERPETMTGGGCDE